MKKFVHLFLLFPLLCNTIIAQSESLPDVEVTSVDGTKIKLQKVIDKLTILDFWATWCTPCIAENPYLDKISDQYKGKINILSISIDENVDKWKAFLTKTNKTRNQFWVEANNELQDVITEKKTNIRGEAYTELYIPRFFLIDKNFNVLSRELPPPSTGQLQKVLDSYL
ncbi:TlpA family protein disulfide reductase [Aquimarina sp. ERC-38]|uniref:TlpA family protein disulfide reductase n=1 Tax=Aquimarina sp. ERC-38 TaxID=2949996 RepID=UPI0022480723|nr:TlpA disulfide reductase family protein [Aquimarina sp. ERC-38]UZO80312.1 TlpA family protein disulfide reductase [Aquimarina sp. ERC-38]